MSHAEWNIWNILMGILIHQGEEFMLDRWTANWYLFNIFHENYSQSSFSLWKEVDHNPEKLAYMNAREWEIMIQVRK